MVESAPRQVSVEQPFSDATQSVRKETQKNHEKPGRPAPTVAMEKQEQETGKIKKTKTVFEFWRDRAEFLPATVEFLRGCGIDPGYVNPTPLGEGLNKVVFEYHTPEGLPKVIKVTRFVSQGLMSTGYLQDKENIAILNKYFGSYATPTDIRQDPVSGRSIIIQDRVKGQVLTNKIESPWIRAQLVDLARLNREMMRQTGYSLDFIGVPGFLTWLRHQFFRVITRRSEIQLANILIDQSGSLKIIDEGLHRFRNVSLKQRLTSQVGFLLNRLILRLYFGVDLQPNS